MVRVALLKRALDELATLSTDELTGHGLIAFNDFRIQRPLSLSPYRIQ
jgi:hypothetical protein